MQYNPQYVYHMVSVGRAYRREVNVFSRYTARCFVFVVFSGQLRYRNCLLMDLRTHLCASKARGLTTRPSAILKLGDAGRAQPREANICILAGLMRTMRRLQDYCDIVKQQMRWQTPYLGFEGSVSGHWTICAMASSESHPR